MNSTKILMVSDNVDVNNKEIANSPEAVSKLGYLKYFSVILKALKKNIVVEDIWMGGKGGTFTTTYNEKVAGYNIFAFRDANQILEKLNPDLIMLATTHEYSSRSILYAAKSRSIPTVIIYSGLPPETTKKSVGKNISIRLNQLTTSGKIFFKKYNFLIKTILGSGHSISYLIKTILDDIYTLSTSVLGAEFRFDFADMYICSNFYWADQAIKKGINKQKIMVTGEYAVDPIYDKISSLNKKKKSDKTEILFITTALVEHGFWKPSMRKELVTKVVKAIKEQAGDITNLRFKIHPTAERIEDYEEIIKPIDPSIRIFKHEDLSSLINESDLIITTGGPSAVLLEIILLKKPLFIMNLFNENDGSIYLKEKVVTECHNTDMLIQKIKDGSYASIDKEKIDAFMEKLLYKFDGKCGERAANHILSLIKKN